jgi:hypothetical protein
VMRRRPEEDEGMNDLDRALTEETWKKQEWGWKKSLKISEEWIDRMRHPCGHVRVQLQVHSSAQILMSHSWRLCSEWLTIDFHMQDATGLRPESTQTIRRARVKEPTA